MKNVLGFYKSAKCFMAILEVSEECAGMDL